MTAITQLSKPRTAPLAQGFLAIAGIVLNLVMIFVRAAKHRRDAAALAGFDDRMLADIGLTRGDLRDAFAQPLWRDPTSVLLDRAAERRFWRRRTSFADAVPAVAALAIAAPSIVPALNAGGAPMVILRKAS